MKLACFFLPFGLVFAEGVVCVKKVRGGDLCIEKVGIPSDYVRSFEPVAERPLAETESQHEFDLNDPKEFFRKDKNRRVDNSPGFLWRILGRSLWNDFGSDIGQINLDVFCGVMSSNKNMTANVTNTPVTLYFKNVENVMQPIATGFNPTDYLSLGFGKYTENVVEVVATRNDYSSADKFLFSTNFCVEDIKRTPQI